MIFPAGTNLKLRNKPWATIGIMAANVLFYIHHRPENRPNVRIAYIGMKEVTHPLHQNGLGPQPSEPRKHIEVDKEIFRRAVIRRSMPESPVHSLRPAILTARTDLGALEPTATLRAQGIHRIVSVLNPRAHSSSVVLVVLDNTLLLGDLRCNHNQHKHSGTYPYRDSRAVLSNCVIPSTPVLSNKTAMSQSSCSYPPHTQSNIIIPTARATSGRTYSQHQ